MILAVMLIRVSYLQIRNRYRERREEALAKEPEFLSYKKDVLIKWLWIWDYTLIPSTNNYRVFDLKPLCKIDHTLLDKNGNKGYICPHCKTIYGDNLDSEFSKVEDKETIVKLIEINIKKIMDNQ
jgi:hypothetical protein